MNVIDDWGCFRGEPWHERAQAIAADVDARRGIAAHVLFGRPLVRFARLQAESHAGQRYRHMRRSGTS